MEEVSDFLRGVRSRSRAWLGGEEGRVRDGTVEESMKEPASRRGSGGRWWEKGKSGRVGS